MEWGYTLSSEEFAASDLVMQAALAEDAGFDFQTVSDHFHPWTRSQGQSPFVWSTLGAVATRTRRTPVGTGVTCPIIRIHPAIVAHAAATVSALADGRFFLGLGTGEALNEHITGQRWPTIEVRRDMLAEAIGIIRALWTGETVDHHGPHYTVENARLFSNPEHRIPIIVAAGGTAAAQFAAEHADGLWVTSPNADTVGAYRDAGGTGPVYGQLTVCWAHDEDTARRTALRVWPNAAIPGQLSQDLPTWTHFEQAATMATEEQVASTVVCGPDVKGVVEAAGAYRDAGVDHLHFHQVGPDQRGFIDWWRHELQAAL